MDGWNSNKIYSLNEVFEKLNEAEYELKNCVRGCYTGCSTYEELGQFIQHLAEQLKAAGEEIEYEMEDEPEYDESDEDEN